MSSIFSACSHSYNSRRAGDESAIFSRPPNFFKEGTGRKRERPRRRKEMEQNPEIELLMHLVREKRLPWKTAKYISTRMWSEGAKRDDWH